MSHHRRALASVAPRPRHDGCCLDPAAGAHQPHPLAGLASTVAALFVLGAGAWLTSQAVLGIGL